jgi:hypothetical protein
MTKPSSFSTMCTSNCAFELVGLLLSLSIFHPNAKVYILTDTKTKQIISEITPSPKLSINYFIELDKYDGMNRQIMENKGLWSDFQMSKANIIKYALADSADTLLLDSDIIITDVIDDIDNSKDIGVSPHYMRKDITDKYGYFNGGMLWTKNANVPDKWIEYTKTSRYFDQASIENLSNVFSYFEFGENYNVQGWRMQLSDEGESNFINNVTHKHNDKVYYKNKPLKFIHTHFLDRRFDKFNQLFIGQFKKANMYKILLIIFRVIHNKWLLKIPKQPITGLGFHNNDSFRELIVLMKSRTTDVDIQLTTNSIHCWIEPNVLMYDRPTLEWGNNELQNASLMLIGNGDVNVEGKIINKSLSNLIVNPWIFWPRKPMILEHILKNETTLPFDQRHTESIFIGNIENSVQNKYRSNNKWSDVITEYHCTEGTKHLFSHKEYLMKIRQSKYGLCMRGYGSKCHREVELMAFGVVPLVTEGVTTTSYMEPLIENTHYLMVYSPDDLTSKLQNMTEHKWNIMSLNCYEWYQRNVHSKNCWNNMISNILYG